jgi:hypothetical protein
MTSKANRPFDFAMRVRQAVTRLRRPVLTGVGVLAFATIGTVLLVNSRAATPVASFEAEAGTRSGNATLVSDAGASGGQAVRFNTPATSTAGFCDSFPALPTVKPTATNTGVPAGTTLTNSSTITVNTAGTTINAMHVSGGIVVNANNVTIQNTKVNVSGYYGIQVKSGVTGTKVLHSEIYTTNGGYVGILAANTTVCGSYIHGFENGMTIDGGMMVQANYVDKLAGTTAEPHYDGIEVYGGGAPTRIWGNNILMTSPSGNWLGDTGAINVTAWQGGIDNVDINGNWLGGGSYTLYVDEQGGYNASNVKITNNTWYGAAPRGYAAYGPALIRDSGSVPTWSGNTWENGTALAR